MKIDRSPTGSVGPTPRKSAKKKVQLFIKQNSEVVIGVSIITTIVIVLFTIKWDEIVQFVDILFSK